MSAVAKIETSNFNVTRPVRRRSLEWGRLQQGTIDLIQRHCEALPVKVSAICRDFGVRIVSAPLPARISGEIRPSASAGAGFEIKVNRYEAEVRQRFTAAHELAHFLLHRDLINDGVVDSVLYRSKLSNAREAEANRLAADILMPYERLSDLGLTDVPFSITEADVSEYAEIFKVSDVALRFRIGI